MRVISELSSGLKITNVFSEGFFSINLRDG